MKPTDGKEHDNPSGSKKAEERLCEIELRYRAIFEQSPYGILIIDTNGVPIEFNEEAHRQLGYTRERGDRHTAKERL